MRCLWGLVAAATIACAQPAFDVASLKPSRAIGPGELYTANLGTARNGEVLASNVTLAEAIKFAYGLVSDDQLAGADWIKSKEVRFDIVGKAAKETQREELLLMLRRLLDERFHLAMHRERRAFSHYVLSVAKGGAKIQEVTPDPAGARTTYRIGQLAHPQITMQTFAMLLSRQLKSLVLDETGLAGAYAVDVKWTPEGSETDNGPSIYSALQQQLGLRLEGRKDAVEVMVVDRADRVPAEN